MQTAFTRARHVALAVVAVSGCGVHLATPHRPATVATGGGTTLTSPPSTYASLLSAGPEYTCAIHAGQVFCWGRNNDGQLGDGTTVNRSKPTAVVGVRDAVAVRSSEHLACAVLRGGEVTCWGDGLGARLIAGIADAIDVAPSFRLVCAVRRSGKVSCAGLPWRYEDKAKRTTPVLTDIAGVDDAIGIASSRRETCVVRRAGALACFGHHWRDWPREWVRRICEAAKVPVVCAHSMRGLHSTLAMDAGVTGHVVAASLGHEQVSTTIESYAKPEAVAGARQRRALTVLAGGVG